MPVVLLEDSLHHDTSVAVLSIWLSLLSATHGQAESLKDELYERGSTVGRILFEVYDEEYNVLQSEEVDVSLEFLQRGDGEYDFRSIGGPTLSCSGKLEFSEAFEDASWQTVELKLDPGMPNSASCPQDGFLILSRRADEDGIVPIKIGYRADGNIQLGLVLNGAVFLPLENVADEPEFAAKGLPKYDGVYVGLKDGSYVNLTRLNLAQSQVLYLPGGPNLNTLNFADPRSAGQVPTVIASEIETVFVKSREDSISEIMPVFDAKQVLFQGDAEYYDFEFKIARHDNTFGGSEFESVFGASDCVWTADKFSSRSISETESEIVFADSRVRMVDLLSGAINSKWKVHGGTRSSSCVGSFPAQGLAVRVVGQTLGRERGGVVYWVRYAQ